MVKLVAIDLVLDNYRGGNTTEICVATREEYERVLTKHLTSHQDNFVSVYSCNGGKNYTIEPGDDNQYNISETIYPVKVTSLPLDMALKYIFENVNKN